MGIGLVQASKFKILLTLLPHLQLALFLLAVDAGQVHAVEPAVLLRLVPVSLQKCHFSHLCFCHLCVWFDIEEKYDNFHLEKYSEVVFLSPKFLKRHCVRFTRVDCESRS